MSLKNPKFLAVREDAQKRADEQNKCFILYVTKGNWDVPIIESIDVATKNIRKLPDGSVDHVEMHYPNTERFKRVVEVI